MTFIRLLYLIKPWASNANPNSLRSKLFNKYTAPGNPVEKQVDFHPYTGEIYKVHDPPLSNNDRCSMFHDIAYTIAQNVGQNPKDVKNRKLDADKEWLDCFKVRTPYDMIADSAIKTKKIRFREQFHNGRFIKRIKQTNNQ